MRAKIGALPWAFGLPFYIINRIEKVLLSICAIVYVMFIVFANLHSVVNQLKMVQCSVAKHFMYCKHNITLWNTQAFWQKVVTFFEECESWSHTSLFVWDWNCRARVIASNCARFYGVAKCVTLKIWLDLCPKPRHQLTS